jgi:hypothetical protein
MRDFSPRLSALRRALGRSLCKAALTRPVAKPAGEFFSAPGVRTCLRSPSPLADAPALAATDPPWMRATG